MSIELKSRMKICAPANKVFEAIVDPQKIGNFWFSSGSRRWEAGETITLSYKELDVLVNIKVTEIVIDKKIVYIWGELEEENTVTFEIKSSVNKDHTIIEIIETGWREDDKRLTEKLLQNKEGWVYMLTCLKAYLENDISSLRTGLIAKQ